MKEVKFDYIYRNAKGELLSTKLTLDEIEKGIRGAGSIFIDVIARRQFTGIKDKYGTEIYEGDVLENEHGRFFVFWFNDYAAWQQDSRDGHKEFLTNHLGNRHTDKVIGNIYSNPELVGEY